jgi:hypothetical protein
MTGGDDDNAKKIDPKKHKKHTQFLLYSYCHYILEIYNRLADKPEINFAILIPLINNYILNLFTIFVANQINLDAAKSLIDEAVIIVLDYISISHEDEFQKPNYHPRFNDAIHFSWQKIHDRIIKLMPVSKPSTAPHNMSQGQLLGTSPRSLPSNLSSNIDYTYGTATQSSINTPTNKTSIKKKMPTPGKKIPNLLNYISITGSSANRTSKSIIISCDIITRIFNLFAVVYPLKLTDSIQNNWMELFEPINPNILACDTHEDEVQYSNSVFFTRLTYNLDILECFINMLIPQLLKISQSIVVPTHFDMIIGSKIANNINQIYSRLLMVNNIHVPSFIYLTIIYNYLHSPFDIIMDDDNLLRVNHCCSIGLYLGICLNIKPGLQHNPDKYFFAIENLKCILGQQLESRDKSNTKKIINNRNLITAIINLNSYISE